MDSPDLTGHESFGVRMNWDSFEGESAFGFSATGVVARDVFSRGDRVALGAGIGAGVSGDTLGGRVGIQWSW